MNNTINWNQTVEFDAFSHWEGYENLIIPTLLTWKQLFIAIGTLMLSSNRISHIHHEFNCTLYGNYPVFCVREFDFNSFLISLSEAKMIKIDGNEIVELTDVGRRFVFANQDSMSCFFAEKRMETKEIINSLI